MLLLEAHFFPAAMLAFYPVCNINFRIMTTIPFKAISIVGRATDFSSHSPKTPLYGTAVQAGWPSPADDYIEERINLHEIAVKNPPATFFLRAAGDSMIGVGIHDGDLLVVDRSVEAANGKVVIAALDGELLVKKLLCRKGRSYLMPANPDFPEIDITDREYVHVWGVVTFCLHKL